MTDNPYDADIMYAIQSKLLFRDVNIMSWLTVYALYVSLSAVPGRAPQGLGWAQPRTAVSRSQLQNAAARALILLCLLI